jgi:hypothetical protein
MNDDIDLSDTSTITLDSPTVSYYGSSGATALDAITSLDISALQLPTMGSICYTTSTSSPCTITIGNGASNAYNWNSNCYTYSTGTTSINNNAKVKLDDTGISIAEAGDIKLGERSLKEFMLKMEERMAILVPDPKKLEKFAALKKAYEHYKTLESLCFIEEEVEQK